jgi:hypothetical protein
MKNRVFFSQTALDEWIAEDRVDIRHDELTIKSEGRRYRIIEALRVVEEVTGTPDTNELLDKVKSLAFLSELGAEILGTSMILGDNAYECVPGFVGAPIGTFTEHRKSLPDVAPKGALTSDEDLLAAFLASNV